MEKQSFQQETTIDRLPSEVIEYILCLVPIQEAARTSILSKKWRLSWTKMQKLVFDENTFQLSGDELYDDVENERRNMTRRCGIFSAIFQVLLKHHDPIVEFSLKIQTNTSCVEVDSIISYLSIKNTLKKLTLDTDWGFYRIPSYLFAFDGLTELRVISCTLDRQHKFNGFINLNVLFLKGIMTSKSSLVHLLAGCPSLKRLTLEADDVQADNNSTIINLFDYFSVLEYLSMNFPTGEPFIEGIIPQVLPNPLLHLKEVCLVEMRFFDERELLFLAFLIRSSPNLEKLKLEAMDELPSPTNVALSFKLEDHPDIWLNHLSVLEFFNMDNGELYLDVVKLILATALC